MAQNIFKNPFVSVVPTLTPTSIGNGTLTIDKLTHFTINQDYMAICTAISPFTVFNIVGLLDGAVGVAIVGTQFHDEDLKVFLTIQQGPVLFEIGDTFNFSVTQGTDVTQGNLDSYDELPQKNFGQGQVGVNSGDNNIRFSSLPKKAFKVIGDLKFESVSNGPIGNDISIEYLAGSFAATAFRTIQSLTYTANLIGPSGNNISVEYEDYTAAIKASRTFQNILFEADIAGAVGNAISIEFTSGGTAGSEVVGVIGNAITVQIQSGVSTVNNILLALSLSVPASNLIEAFNTGTGLENVTVQVQTFLIGGADAIGDAGNEVITVISNAIKIKFQSGVSTAQNIFDKALLTPALLALVTPTITGVSSTTQTAPVTPLNLQGGANNVGIPGSEIVTVSAKEIKVTFINGASTAQQIKTAIEAVPAAIALINTTLEGIGSELQSSPVARTFLTGGSNSGSYAFNQTELSSPGTFYEGNAPILVTDIVNQGDESTFGETLKKGKVTLDDDILSNLSGPKVDNAQKTINNIIQNSKAIILTEDHSKTIWQKPNLTFSADILFIFSETGVINRILTSNSPIVINDNEHCYVTINRETNATVSPIVAGSVPTGENIFRLFSRKGDFLIWYDNTLQKDKKKIRIGEGGGGGTAYQEKIGVGNGIATNFPLTFIPSNEFSILVICSYIRQVGYDYNYNALTNSIDFVGAYKPAAGQDIYVMYLTEGETIEVPSPTGLENVFVHTITSLEATSKVFTLPNTPAIAGKVLVDVINGGPQEFNVDFNISVDQFQWAGYTLDGILEAGDKIRFHYYS